MEEFFEKFRKKALIIKEQYPSFRMWDDGSAIILYQGIQEHQLIKEFLYTINPDKVINIINKRFGNEIKLIHKQDVKNSKFILIIIENPSQELIEKINKKLDSLGYFNANKSDKLPNNILEKTTITLQFEPKYDIQINPQPFTYHLTPDFNWKKIRTLGLTPKTQEKISKHPGRVYLVDKINEDDIEELAITLWENNKSRNIIRNMELLKIDMSKLKDNKFFEDPKFHFGENREAIYTYENIPPYAISHIKSILVNPRNEEPGPNPYIK